MLCVYTVLMITGQNGDYNNWGTFANSPLADEHPTIWYASLHVKNMTFTTRVSLEPPFQPAQSSIESVTAHDKNYAEQAGLTCM